jgi:hypothetical protein
MHVPGQGEVGRVFCAGKFAYSVCKDFLTHPPVEVYKNVRWLTEAPLVVFQLLDDHQPDGITKAAQFSDEFSETP